MSCYCKKSLEESLMPIKSRGAGERMRYMNQLEAFKEGIKSGAYELIARHLFNAGVYYASLDNGLKNNPSVEVVLQSLRRRLIGRAGLLFDFLERNKQLVIRQSEIVNTNVLLRKLLAQGSKAIGLLEGNGDREVNEAIRIMDRLNRLERYLVSWREGGLDEFRYEIVKIVDMHD
ncbi:MAG: hypothetical protein QXS66_07905 [Thermoproteota archaeon]